MTKKSEAIKDGVLVTIGSIIAWIVAFGLYFLIFMLFETRANPDGSYRFVAWVRMGYGLVWLLLCLGIYRTRLPEWIKASVLAGAVTTFLAAFGVQLFETPLITGLLILIVAATIVYLLHKLKMEWFHYYAVLLSILATLFYLFPFR